MPQDGGHELRRARTAGRPEQWPGAGELDDRGLLYYQLGLLNQQRGRNWTRLLRNTAAGRVQRTGPTEREGFLAPQQVGRS